ncbi:MAG: cob(I)yrinic acid a,c-diamide adenosyltransferase, partial [Tepidanaerobacteraceae bacterium]
MEKGYIQVYTGNGKGKTTAALGLSLRAVCAGKKVFFAQFVKGMRYSELDAEKYLPGLTIKQFGRQCFIYDEPTEEDIEAAV